MALSGSLKTNDYNGRYYELTWSATQDIATNKSTVTWELQAKGSSGWYAERTLYVEVNGLVLVDKTDRVQRYAGKVAGDSFTCNHDTKGNSSLSFSIKAAVYYTDVNLTGGKTFTLNQIPRQATLTGAPDFNSLEAPVIYYSNPAGNSVSSLEACISLSDKVDGTPNDEIPYRAVSKTGTSYIFYLTDTEMNTLKKATSGKSRTVKFVLKTVIGGNTYHSQLTKTFSIDEDDGAPTINPTVYDTNETTIALTGDNNRIIPGYSNAYYSIGAAAATGATIKSVSAKNGSATLTSTTGTFNKATSNVFNFSATDSRGNTAFKKVEKTLVNYFIPTGELTTDLTTDGELTVVLSGTFFNQSFGAVNNTIAVICSVYPADEEPPKFVSYYTPENYAEMFSISGNNYTFTYTKSNLDYKKAYFLYLAVEDKIIRLKWRKEGTSISSTPVFDWSKEDFNFNVPVKMDGDIVLRRNEANTVLAANGGFVYIRPNGDTDTSSEVRIGDNTLFNLWGSYTVQADEIKLSSNDNTISGDCLFNGDIQTLGGLTINTYQKVGVQNILFTVPNARYMLNMDSHTIEFTGANRITNMVNGYILVWSYYSNGTIYADNINYTYIPKYVANLYSGKITVPLHMDTGTHGSKTLYITDNGTKTTIKGHAKNETSPNNQWVLRYVISW